MSWPRYYIVFLVGFLPVFTAAQAIDNTLSFRNISSDHYFRINYENDFFSGTDRDYTQGIYIEKVTPGLRGFFLTKVLWQPRSWRQRDCPVKYGLALEHDMYTPNFLDRPEIQYGDRPYAGVILLKTFLTATDTEGRQRISTLLSTGLIGPDAGGEGMQKAIHHLIDYTQPVGWHNQISNDLVLNYQVNYEKELFSCKYDAGGGAHYTDRFSLATFSSLRLGTLSSKLATGVTIMLGNFYSPFTHPVDRPGKKIQWYFYDQPLVNLVGYDATLQGGVFNRSSPYTIAASDVNRLVFQHRYGFILIFHKLFLEYYQTSNTAEFKTSVYHGTGGLQIGFGF
jgi:lipid A 3-O-deacylase